MKYYIVYSTKYSWGIVIYAQNMKMARIGVCEAAELKDSEVIKVSHVLWRDIHPK